jgi:hypothetical protein
LFDRHGFIACNDVQTDAARVGAARAPGRPRLVTATG